MQKVSILKQLLIDIASLRDPKTAAAILGLAVVLVGPLFGWHPNAAVKDSILGAIVAVGVIASYVEAKFRLETRAIGHALLSVLQEPSQKAAEGAQEPSSSHAAPPRPTDPPIGAPGT